MSSNAHYGVGDSFDGIVWCLDPILMDETRLFYVAIMADSSLSCMYHDRTQLKGPAPDNVFLYTELILGLCFLRR